MITYKEVLNKIASRANWLPKAIQAAVNRYNRLLTSFPSTTQANLKQIYKAIGSMKRFTGPDVATISKMPKPPQHYKDPLWMKLQNTYSNIADRQFSKSREMTPRLERAWDLRNMARKANENRKNRFLSFIQKLRAQYPRGFVYSQPPSLGHTEESVSGLLSTLSPLENSFALPQANRIFLGDGVFRSLPVAFHQMGHIFDVNRYPNIANLKTNAGALLRQRRATALGLLGMRRSGKFTQTQIMKAKKALKAAYKAHKYSRQLSQL